MDLKERKNSGRFRHPWELSRVEALKKVLRPHLYEGIRILDLGCGDGFVSRKLFDGLGNKEITAVDKNLSAQHLLELRALAPEIRYLQQAPQGIFFDLLLVLDVMEHVEDDLAFLASGVDSHLAAGGKVLVTVPSFPLLYGWHDLLLGHYRRYTLDTVEAVATAAGLEVVGSGHLFGTLTLPKLLCNKLWARGIGSAGVGNWRCGELVTSSLQALLDLDNALMLAAAKRGVRIPGLSAWALCRKAEAEVPARSAAAKDGV